MKKFIISTQALRRALQKLSHAVLARHTLPITGSIWCKVTDKAIELIATDLEVTIFYRMECETTGDGFEFLLPFQQIMQIVALYKNVPMTFSEEKKGIRITVINEAAQNESYDIKSPHKIEDFPKLQQVPKKNAIVIDSTLIGWLNTALKTVGADETLYPNMTKVLLELRKDKATIASSDRQHFVFSYSLPLASPIDQDILISPKVIKTIEGIEEASLSWTEKVFAIVSKDISVIVTRPDLKFVKFRAIFPADFPANLSLKREDLVDALEKCNINSDPFKQTTLHLKSKDGAVRFSARDTQFGINISIPVPGEYTGALDSIKFNCSFMLRLMHQISFENIGIAIHDETRPVVFSSSDDAGYLSLLMAMHVKSKSEE